MANSLTDNGKEQLLNGAIDWDTDTIKVVLTKGSPSPSTTDNLSDIASGARAGSPQTLGSKTITNGVADAADAIVPSVAAGSPIDSVAIYKDSGVESTSTVIAILDSGTGFPVTPDGGNITITWDNGANKIFSL